MKNRKLTIVIIGVLLILTAILALIHLTAREKETTDALQIVLHGKTVTLALDELKPLERVSGSVVNGRGEITQVDTEGISVKNVLALAGMTDDTSVQVIAADEYSVAVAAEETGEVWLLMEEDGLRLVVFGDPDSRRNVRNVVRLSVE